MTPCAQAHASTPPVCFHSSGDLPTGRSASTAAEQRACGPCRRRAPPRPAPQTPGPRRPRPALPALARRSTAAPSMHSLASGNRCDRLARPYPDSHASRRRAGAGAEATARRMLPAQKPVQDAVPSLNTINATTIYNPNPTPNHPPQHSARTCGDQAGRRQRRRGAAPQRVLHRQQRQPRVLAPHVRGHLRRAADRLGQGNPSPIP